jgi:hypothetical protein
MTDFRISLISARKSYFMFTPALQRGEKFIWQEIMQQTEDNNLLIL